MVGTKRCTFRHFDHNTSYRPTFLAASDSIISFCDESLWWKSISGELFSPHFAQENVNLYSLNHLRTRFLLFRTRAICVALFFCHHLAWYCLFFSLSCRGMGQNLAGCEDLPYKQVLGRVRFPPVPLSLLISNNRNYKIIRGSDSLLPY